MIKRFVLYILGILCLGFGIVLNTKAGLGISPINTVPYAVSEITVLTLGQVTTLLYFVFVVIQLMICRKKDIKVLLQIPFSYVMGAVIDFYNNLLNFQADSFTVGLLMVAFAIIVTAFGAYLIVSMELVPNPADEMTQALGKILHKEFGEAKLIFDFLMIGITVIITLVFAGKLIGIGIGTVLSALFIGRMIQIFSHYFQSYLRSIVAKSRKE